MTQIFKTFSEFLDREDKKLKPGYDLEEKTSTLFAAMQIYHKSSEIRVSPTRFFETNEVALADIKKCAEKEKEIV